MTFDEIVTLSMLLGDHPPRMCLNCSGEGSRPLLYDTYQCKSCFGDGADWIGMKTRKAMRERFHVDMINGETE